MTTSLEEHVSQIRDERKLAAVPEVVWEGVSTADGLLGWFWSPRLDPRIEIDLRVGGRYRIASPVAGMAVSGEYTTVFGRDPEGNRFEIFWEQEPAWSD